MPAPPTRIPFLGLLCVLLAGLAGTAGAQPGLEELDVLHAHAPAPPPQGRDLPPPASALLPPAMRARPLGYLALDLEQEAGLPVDDRDYARLDRLVAAARASLPLKPSGNYTRNEARAVLEALSELVEQACTAQQENADGGLYSRALRQGTCDCDIYATTYLTLAEVFALPLYGAFAPEHMMLLWDDGATAFFWETTTATVQTAAGYRTTFDLPERSSGEDPYLKKQDKRALVGYLYHNRAGYHYTQGALERALADYHRSIALNPGLVTAFNNRGETLMALGRPAEAVADYTRAIEMHPRFAAAYYGRGSARVALHQHAEAEADFDRVLALEGETADARYGRGLARHRLGRFEEALQDYTRALALDSTLTQAYYNRADAFAQAGFVVEAMQDYVTFISRARTDPVYTPYIPQAQRRLLQLKHQPEPETTL